MPTTPTAAAALSLTAAAVTTSFSPFRPLLSPTTSAAAAAAAAPASSAPQSLSAIPLLHLARILPAVLALADPQPTNHDNDVDVGDASVLAHAAESPLAPLTPALLASGSHHDSSSSPSTPTSSSAALTAASRTSALDHVDRTGTHVSFLVDTLTFAAQAQSNPKSVICTSSPGLFPLLVAVLARALSAPTPVWYSALADSVPIALETPAAASLPISPASLIVRAIASTAKLGARPHELCAVGLTLVPILSDSDPARELAIDLVARGASALAQLRESNLIHPDLDKHLTALSQAATPLIARRLLSPSSSIVDHTMSEENTLSAVLRTAGYPVLASPDTFYQCLSSYFGTPAAASAALGNPTLVGRAIGLMSMTHNDPEAVGTAAASPPDWLSVLNDVKHTKSTWDMEAFVATVTRYARPAPPDWTAALRALDYEGFVCRDLQGFALILEAHRRGTAKSNVIGNTAAASLRKFPVAAVVFSVWTHAYAQYTLLAQCVSAPPDVFNFADYSPVELRRVVPTDDLAVATSGATRSPITSLPNQALNALDVLATLRRLLDDPACAAEVKQFLFNASVQAPELLVLGLVQLPGAPWDGAHAERVSALTREFLLGKPTSGFVLPRLWTLAPTVLIRGMVDLHAEDPSRLSRLLDVCQELKALGDILKRTPFHFALDLAALASRREFLNLDRWIGDMVGEHGSAFVRAAIDYVMTRVDSPKSPLSADVAAFFAKQLSQYAQRLADARAEGSSDLPERVAALQAALSGKGETGFPRDVEQQAMTMFDFFYKGELPLLEMVARLAQLHAAPDRTAQDTFACALAIFMDERKYFASFPDATMLLSADLIGQLVARGLLAAAGNGMPGAVTAPPPPPGTSLLDIALQFILESLQAGEGTKMFTFGSRSLGQFLGRVTEFPAFAKQIVLIPSIAAQVPDLVNLVEESMPSKVFRAITIDEAMVSDLPTDAPPEVVKDKVLFLLNNLSVATLDVKVKDAAALVTTDRMRWFAQYLVRRRAAVEPNYQPLYLSLIKAWNNRELERTVLYETYVLTESVINADKTTEDANERTKLKNIGAWLGGLTLARDRPIKHKHIAVKEILLEGYKHQRLMVAVPFICQLLSQARHSAVFHPPNPWLMAILGVLVELYHVAEIKLNLKFEIEVLCKNISIELNNIKPTNYLLKMRAARLGPGPELGAITGPLAAGSDVASSGSVATGPGNGVSTGALPTVPGEAGGLPTGRGGNGGAPFAAAGQQESASTLLQNLGHHIVLSPAVAIFGTQPVLKRLVHVAFDRAIRETLAPVVERSVTISSISMRDLIGKDFASEPNEMHVLKASLMMAQHLAGSLAIVTCKEPLRLAMSTNLRTLLLQNGVSEQLVSDQVLMMVVNDNIDLGCLVIERAAMEKAAPEVDEVMGPALLKRKQARERNQPWREMPEASMLAREYLSRLPMLPDVLKIKMGGLQPAQLAVYGEFGRRLGRGQGGAALLTPGGGAADANGSGTVDEPTEMTLQQSIDQFTTGMTNLDAQLAQSSMFASLDELPVGNELRSLMTAIPQMLPSMGNPSREELAQLFCTKVIQALYSAASDLVRDTYAVVLRDLCAAAPRAGREVVQWLLYAEDERKYNVRATCALMQVRILPILELDAQLARLIEAGKNLVEYAMQIISLTTEQGIAVDSEWFNTIDIMYRLVQSGKVPESVNVFIADLRQRTIRAAMEEAQQHASNGADAANGAIQLEDGTTAVTTTNGISDAMSEKLQLREDLTYLFADWVRFLHAQMVAGPGTTGDADAAFARFATDVQHSVVYKSADTLCLFVRQCTQLSIDAWLTAAKSNAPPTTACQALDALAKLVLVLTVHHDEAVLPQGALPTRLTSEVRKTRTGEPLTSANRARALLFSKMLSVIVLVLVGAHETQQQQFNQRPFFRLLSSLLYELNTREAALHAVYHDLLDSFADVLHTVQPTVLPGFAFSWLGLLAHRQFMPKMLLQDGQQGWTSFARLLLALFRFLIPFLRDGLLRDPTRVLYRGTLRILLVLLHDFPEFLCENYYPLCNVIPPGCLQLRNLILSAFPRMMRLPDPFSQNLRMDVLQDSRVIPKVPADELRSALAQIGLASNQWEPVLAAAKIRHPEGVTDEVTGSTYNVPLINAIVLLAGYQDTVAMAASEDAAVVAAAAMAVANGDPGATMPAMPAIPVGEGSAARFLRDLIAELDSEGRYYVLSAVANHLRYPNAHTRYFSELVLYLFQQRSSVRGPTLANGTPEPASLATGAAGHADSLPEQVTRVLLERLVASRPHPWGLLVTFIELIKNDKYAFWGFGFTRCAPEMERLFESVSRSVNHQH
ncbi:CCR4-Not complex component, Not1-domain-containing protein [Blastocladiella britannica]|nr:CCR4-Not complex component, Not1-domain-containing protein [Blastocladiella britannica]